MRNIIFDLDGTLIDSAPSIMNSLNLALSSRGYEAASLERVTSLLGSEALLLVRAAVIAGGAEINEQRCREVVADFISNYSDHPAEGSRLFPHALEILEEIRSNGYKLAICTNKPSKTAWPVLKAFGLESYFDALSFGDSGAFKKPDGRHILETIVALGGYPQDSVMVGDAANDIQAANDAGVASVLVSFGYDFPGGQAAGPNAIVNDLQSLPRLIKFL